MPQPPQEHSCQLILIGSPAMNCGDRIIDGQRWGRFFELLAYVAIQGRAREVVREEVGQLIWPDANSSRQLSNLRQLLHLLHKQLPAGSPPVIESSSKGLRLAPYVFCDAAEILADAPLVATLADSAEVERRLALNRGEFLAGLDAKGQNLLRWISNIRDLLLQRLGFDAAALFEMASKRRDAAAVGEFSLRWLDSRAHDEPTGRSILRELFQGGYGREARTFLRRWDELASRGLCAPPGAATRLLITQAEAQAASVATFGNPDLEWRQLALLRIQMPGLRREPVLDESAEEAHASHLALVAESVAATLAPFRAHTTRLPNGTVFAYFGFPSMGGKSVETGWAAMRELRSSMPDLGTAQFVLHAGRALTREQVPDSSGRLMAATDDVVRRLQPGSMVVTGDALQQLHLRDAQLIGPLPIVGGIYAVSAANVKESLSAPSVVGRDGVLAQLLKAWRQSQSGEFTSVLLTGEAGIGKTTLVSAFRKLAGRHWLNLHCTQHDSGTPLQPLLSAVRRDGSTIGRWLGERIGGAARDRYDSPLPTTLGTQGDSYLAKFVASLASATRLLPEGLNVLLVEDLQWADPSTRGLLTSLMTTLTRVPLLVIATSREAKDRELGPWTLHVALAPLDESAAEILVHGISPDLGLRDTQAVIGMANGNPLFLSELARAPSHAASPSIDELVAGQVESLGDAKGLAYFAAALGDPFRQEWLEGEQVGPGDLVTRLDALTTAGLLVRQRGNSLSFRHALVRDAVLRSLPPRRRQEIFYNVASFVTSAFPSEALTMPERIARWYAEANDWEESVRWRTRAGAYAIALSAFKEARQHLQLILAQLPRLPKGKRRDDLERTARAELGAALIVAGGHGESAYENCLRLLELAREAKDSAAEIEALWNLTFVVEQRRGYRGVLHVLRQMQGTGVLPAKVDETRLHALTFFGRLRQARTLLEALKGPTSPIPPTARGLFSHEVSVGILVRKAYLDWLAGNWRESRDACDHVLELTGADQSNGKNGLGFILANTLISCLLLEAQLPELARPLVKQLLETQPDGVFAYAAFASALEGWTDILDGALQAGAEKIVAAIQSDQSSFVIWHAPLHIPLAKAYASLGRHEEAAQAIARARALIAATSQFVFRPTLHIVEAEILMAADGANRPRAVRLIDLAHRVARREDNRAGALRASLAHWRLASDRESLVQLMDEVANLAEQPDWPDLLEARRIVAAEPMLSPLH